MTQQTEVVGYENLPVVNADTPTQPVSSMAPSATLDAVVEAVNAAYVEGRRQTSELAARTAWAIGEAVTPLLPHYDSVNQLYEALVVYGAGASIGSRTNFHWCLKAYGYWPQGLPDGTAMKDVKRLGGISSENTSVPTLQDKPAKADVHALVLDRIGLTWRRKDMQLVAAYLGYEPVAPGEESISRQEGGLLEDADMN